MADLNGVNYQLSQNVPAQKADPSELKGELNVIREEYTISAILASGDKILGPMLPEGARVMDAKVKIDGTLGTGGILDLGHGASSDGSIAADSDAFVVGADAGGQAVLKGPTLANVGIDKKFAKPVQLIAECTEASSVSSGVKISFWVSYFIN